MRDTYMEGIGGKLIAKALHDEEEDGSNKFSVELLYIQPELLLKGNIDKLC